jgi:hypothetical protein
MYAVCLSVSKSVTCARSCLSVFLLEKASRVPGAVAMMRAAWWRLQVVSDANFHVGFNRIYDKNLARSLRGILSKHLEVWPRTKSFDFSHRSTSRCGQEPKALISRFKAPRGVARNRKL